MFSVRSTCNQWVCARVVPKLPGEAPVTATGLPLNSRRPSPRDIQSMAFLKVPGMPLLYSGVTSSNPSAPASCAFSVATAVGVPFAASSSPS